MLGILELDPDLAWVKDQATLVDATEAAHWFFEESGKDTWDLSADMHRLTAPGGRTWIEFAGPPTISTHRSDILPGIQRMGALVMCEEIEPEDRPTAISEATLEQFFGRRVIGGVGGSGGLRDNAYLPKAIAARKELADSGIVPGFLLGFRIFAMISGELSPPIYAALYLDEDGRAFPESMSGCALYFSPILNMSKPLVDALTERGIFTDGMAQEMYHDTMATFAFILSLMNCRNVTLSEPEPIRRQRAERRRMARAGQKPVAYRWLKIKQLQKRADDDASEAGATGHKRRMHQVRAHWAHYDADAPLFGRPGMTGTFFRPQSLRGRADLGEIKKGYHPVPNKEN